MTCLNYEFINGIQCQQRGDFALVENFFIPVHADDTIQHSAWVIVSLLATLTHVRSYRILVMVTVQRTSGNSAATPIRSYWYILLRASKAEALSSKASIPSSGAIELSPFAFCICAINLCPLPLMTYGKLSQISKCALFWESRAYWGRRSGGSPQDKGCLYSNSVTP